MKDFAKKGLGVNDKGVGWVESRTLRCQACRRPLQDGCRTPSESYGSRQNSSPSMSFPVMKGGDGEVHWGLGFSV